MRAFNVESTSSSNIFSLSEGRDKTRQETEPTGTGRPAAECLSRRTRHVRRDPDHHVDSKRAASRTKSKRNVRMCGDNDQASRSVRAPSSSATQKTGSSSRFVPMPTPGRLQACCSCSGTGKPAERGSQQPAGRLGEGSFHLRCPGGQCNPAGTSSSVSTRAPSTAVTWHADIFPLLVSEPNRPTHAGALSTCMLFPSWLSPQTARVPPMLFRSRGSSTSALVCRVKA